MLGVVLGHMLNTSENARAVCGAPCTGPHPAASDTLDRRVPNVQVAGGEDGVLRLWNLGKTPWKAETNLREPLN